MVSWYSDSEIAYSINCQKIWSTIYLDVDLCVTEEGKKCLFTVFVFIQDIVMSVSEMYLSKNGRSCKVHSAWKHNISGHFWKYMKNFKWKLENMPWQLTEISLSTK